jgi:hypothetical protein
MEDGHPLIGDAAFGSSQTRTRNRGVLMGRKWFKTEQLEALNLSAARDR